MTRTAGALAAALATSVVAGAAAADTITVTIGTDPIDIDWQTATIADLPGPDGRVSLSEALIAANNTPGPDTIGFAIPQAEWTFQFAFPGRAVIWTGNSFFWRANEAVTIDGTTQTAFTGDTNPDGGEVVLYGDELYLNAAGSTLTGLDHSSVTMFGTDAHAHGNTGSGNLTIGGGSGARVEDNTGSTLKLDGTSDAVVVGNTFQRVRVIGAPGLGQPAVNNRLGGPDPADRNYFTGYGTWNSEGLPSGHAIQLFGVQGALVENNSIGTTPDGLSQGSLAANTGIRVEGGCEDVTIRGNRIAGILGHGQNPHHAGQRFGSAIYVIGDGSGLEIVGNTIGLDANGDPVLGSVTGVEIEWFAYGGFSDITIGGTGPGEGNTIAGHLFRAVTVGAPVPQVRIAGNSIHSNGQLGIELVSDGFDYGVSPNDPLDADGGGNGLQNFPEIATATTTGSTVRIAGTLPSSPSDEFTLDFFASPACDPSGFGEAEVYLGSTTVVTDAAGDAAFDVLLGGSVPEGWVATATATLEPLGATSEFSACVPFVPGDATGAPVPTPAAALRLLPSAPNPFVDRTTVRFALPAPADVRLTVHDAAGRLVRVLENGRRPAGVHVAAWDGRSEAGDRVAAGVYFWRLSAGDETRTRRAVLLR